MKGRDVVKRLRADGWAMEARKSTSHRSYVHPIKPGKVTLSYEDGDDIPTGTLRNIFRQAGLDWPPR